VAVAVENAGNSIQGDGAPYTDGAEGVDARIWDFDADPPVADHLHFQVEKKFAGRYLRLVIPEQPGLPAGGVNEECQVGRLKPNESLNDVEFYDELPVGQSTSGADNFGGTFKCTTDSRGKTGWFVHWKPVNPCIVITHGEDGNPFSNPLEWRFTAGAGCPADVSRIVNGAVQSPVAAYVPFQVLTTVLP